MRGYFWIDCPILSTGICKTLFLKCVKVENYLVVCKGLFLTQLLRVARSCWKMMSAQY